MLPRVKFPVWCFVIARSGPVIVRDCPALAAEAAPVQLAAAVAMMNRKRVPRVSPVVGMVMLPPDVPGVPVAVTVTPGLGRAGDTHWKLPADGAVLVVLKAYDVPAHVGLVALPVVVRDAPAVIVRLLLAGTVLELTELIKALARPKSKNTAVVVAPVARLVAVSANVTPRSLS